METANGGDGWMRMPSLSRVTAREVTCLLADAYVGAEPPKRPARGSVMCRKWIVRRAEECFLAAGSRRLMLADLCSATGVGVTTLNKAFQDIHGEPPLRYFPKRRLNLARWILVEARPERSAVKQAAIDAGITELGRFSVEYRKLFGKSPSTTLAGGHSAVTEIVAAS
jgi:transcriptional regulator GlxA family with amidase domain